MPTDKVVPQDYAQARQWWEKAAAQGDDLAQTKLGLLYENGRGVPQDFAQARQWYEKAAAKGYALAQGSLGFLYYFGKGVPQDYTQAHLWWSMAAVQGDKIAAQERDKIVTKMTPAQLVEAQRLAQQCQLQQFKGC
ncbi:MAG: tetratricopeptide repeat protein [Nitrospirota bacterium]